MTLTTNPDDNITTRTHLRAIRAALKEQEERDIELEKRVRALADAIDSRNKKQDGIAAVVLRGVKQILSQL